MNRTFRTILAVSLVSLIAAACTDEPAGPQPPGDPPLVGAVAITDSAPELSPQESAPFAARVTSWTGVPMAQGVVWTSRDAAVAAVDAEGRVIGVAPGATWIVAETPNTDGTVVRDSVPLAVVRSWKAITIGTNGNDHLCGTTLDDRVHCWGNNQSAQFGNGEYGFNSPTPTLGAGGARWKVVSAGYHYTCGLDMDDRASCWARIAGGTLWSVAPRAVAGAPAFVSLKTGQHAGCGVTAGGEAWCWGRNYYGGLGLGGRLSFFNDAQQVAGGLTWQTVQPGGSDYTCGLTTAGAAYCWGLLPVGTAEDFMDSLPRPIGGGHVFTALATWEFGACALKADGEAWCWGRNTVGGPSGTTGALGTGTAESSAVPVRVAATERFVKLAAGATRVCGLTAAGQAWCWGSQLGLAPVVQGGEHRFVDIAVADAGICGITAGNALYCWRSPQTAGFDPAQPNRPVRVAHPAGAPTS